MPNVSMRVLLSSWVPRLLVIVLGGLLLGSCSSRVIIEDGPPSDGPPFAEGVTIACDPARCGGTCCDTACVNNEVDPLNCGICGNACVTGEVCESGTCICPLGSEECSPSDLNESPEAPPPLCTLGEERECYDGPEETRNIGACSSGRQVCSSVGWSPCTNQILPAAEACEPNEMDEDCNGVPDDDVDHDQDGWTFCGGDCCDSSYQACPEPALVNPGAFDFPNHIDDDCDGQIDNTPNSDCSPASVTTDVSAQDLVHGLDLCTFATEESRNWGVIRAELLRANGEDAPDPMQVSVLNAFGSLIGPQRNQTLSVLSSGRARGVNDPGFEAADTSFSSWESGVSAPEQYTSVHSALQTSNACPSAEPHVQDSVLLRLRLRVPTNAQGFQYQFRFFSFEYPVYLCTQYNDFYLALLQSEHDMIPEDGNISFDSLGNPVSINSAFFTSCQAFECNDDEVYPQQQGPDTDDDGCVDSLNCNNESGLCQGVLGACPDGPDAVRAFTVNESAGGATSWLVTTAPVIPGEIITLDFHIWDTTDSLLDSTVLLDNFQWRADPTGLSTDKQ